MSQAIHLGASGVIGWKILNQNESKYMEMVRNDFQVQREVRHFSNGIDKIESAADLVNDYRMLNIALKSFGLEGDIANKAFVRKILESDLSDDRSLANRLSDKRYLQLAETFGYGNPAAEKSINVAVVERITQGYLQSEFERRIGEGNERLRVALSARGELQKIRDRGASDKALWYEVLGNQPLREVFEGALGIPVGYRKLPIDRQHAVFSNYAESFLGTNSFKELGDPSFIEKIITRYLLREGTEDMSYNRFNVALMLIASPGTLPH